MGILWGLIAVLLAFVVLATIFDILRRPLSSGVTAAWILAVVLLPFAGSLLYWGMRRPGQDEIDKSRDADAELRRGPPRPTDARFR
jgi:hypothetical protein